LFADNAKLYKHIISEENHESLQVGLNVLQDWSDRSLLKLNASKFKSVFYGRNGNCNYKYYLPSTELKVVETTKELGVLFDSELTFTSHCRETRNKSIVPSRTMHTGRI